MFLLFLPNFFDVVFTFVPCNLDTFPAMMIILCKKPLYLALNKDHLRLNYFAANIRIEVCINRFASLVKCIKWYTRVNIKMFGWYCWNDVFGTY